ncbi:class I histocompatibility antigen, Gogo-C*0203 alpha chain-like isoform X4 [Boleophthalmus pectinirostris]|uniref:class I histocompatibility antigen, Gogo-C*0203 alpha chain-like isoform X4 n=1 Tax=Boleophthalmus pectinirostris TaxID=150288 RepID=UPI00242EE97B|nr:class I histocompatibility antigen, Gogo-C*0203 alpha chain-like isoform X4 [Boleophthalmus pectinirostris]
MRALLLCLLWGTFVCVFSERHSLTYIYTALSKKVSNPGIHEFTAMGLLDTKMIDYFDSDLQEKVPKQTWMKEKLGQDYWDKGTQSRKSKQQWFKVNLDILKERMNQTDEDVHVLQWMHGCEADLIDGKLQFQRGIDQYSYNGNSFLYFDDVHGMWVAAAHEAEPTKRKWDEVVVLKEYTKGYLEKECLDWLSKFMDYGKAQLIHAKPPDVYVFASPGRQKSSVRLNCLATGFYPPDIVLRLIRINGMQKILAEEDGVTSTGIRPNQDDTYQLRKSIEILRTDEAQYSCQVMHAATGVNIKKEWDRNFPPHPDDEEGGFPTGPVIGGIIGLLVLIVGGIVGGVKYKKHLDRTRSENRSSNPMIVSAGLPSQLENETLLNSTAIGLDGRSEDVRKDSDSDKDSNDSARGGSAGSSEDLNKDSDSNRSGSDSARGGSDGSSEDVKKDSASNRSGSGSDSARGLDGSSEDVKKDSDSDNDSNDSARGGSDGSSEDVKKDSASNRSGSGSDSARGLDGSSEDVKKDSDSDNDSNDSARGTRSENRSSNPMILSAGTRSENRSSNPMILSAGTRSENRSSNRMIVSAGLPSQLEKETLLNSTAIGSNGSSSEDVTVTMPLMNN